jgi:hypothetical protein
MSRIYAAYSAGALLGPALAVRTTSSETSPSASSRPAVAPRLSIVRSNLYARP